MVDTKALSLEALLQITISLNTSMHSLVAVIGLLNEGGTVPFIARYRKEATGNLDEVQIRAIEEKLAYFRDLLNRRATILATIEEQGKLADRQIALERLTALIRELKPFDRQVVLLFLEGVDATGIAEVTGISPGNVATKIHRLKNILTRRFQEGRQS